MDDSRLLVVVPAYREEASVGSTVVELRDLGFTVVVVDDGSQDATSIQASRAGAIVLRLPTNLGVGAALRVGFRWAVAHGYTAVVQCDADGQHLPSEISKLLSADPDIDLVIGNRFAANYRDVGRSRRIAMRLLSSVTSRRVGTKITDSTSGFRLIRGDLLGEFARSYPREYLGDTVEAAIWAGSNGYRVGEVDVSMRERMAGVASARGLRAAQYLIRLIMSVTLQGRRT